MFYVFLLLFCQKKKKIKEKRDDGGRKGIVDGRKVIKILVIKLLLETQRR